MNLMVFIADAQILRQPLSGIYSQVNTYSSNTHDVFSFTNNQAALASVKKFSAGVYTERRFLLNELSLYKIATVLPAKPGNFGVQLNYFGSGIFNESELGLAYARRMGKVDAGIQFNYYRLHTQGYSKRSVVNFDVGLMYHINERFLTGIHIYNPVPGNQDYKNQKLPFVYSAGFGYDASDKFFMGAVIMKTENMPVDIRFGMQYHPDEKLVARMGMSTGHSDFYFGAGYHLGRLRIDVTASVHQNLGITPGLMIIYTGKEK